MTGICNGCSNDDVEISVQYFINGAWIKYCKTCEEERRLLDKYKKYDKIEKDGD